MQSPDNWQICKNVSFDTIQEVKRSSRLLAHRLPMPPASTTFSRSDQRSAAHPGSTKVCTKCGRVRAIKHFRRIRKGEEKRHPDCNACQSAFQRGLRRRRREREASRFASQINRHADSERQLVAICNAMWLRFGGPHGVARAFQEAIDNAAGAGRYATSGRLMVAIVHLLDAGQRAESRELRRLSDDELAERTRESLETLVEQTPTLAVNALRAAGYTVLPTDSQEGIDEPIPTN